VPKSSNPLVSVVMPVYNAEKYLAESIESILNQTFKDFEFIIINDASKDGSLKIIEKYASLDKRIKVLKNEFNLKICRTLNKGIKIAKGRYIARMDADDISLPSRFAEQVDYMENHPKCGAVGANIQIFDGNTGKNMSVREYPTEDKILKKNIFFYSPFAHPVIMIRKQALKDCGTYQEIDFPSEDLNLWFRIGRKYEFANLQKILLRYRYYPGSTTGSRVREMEKRANQIRWQHWRDPAYNFGLKAFVYNSLHRLSIYVIPSKFKFWMFSKFRDERK
jgi:glycosyltransferase involved in cell wall biosynthesis